MSLRVRVAVPRDREDDRVRSPARRPTASVAATDTEDAPVVVDDRPRSRSRASRACNRVPAGKREDQRSRGSRRSCRRPACRDGRHRLALAASVSVRPSADSVPPLTRRCSRCSRRRAAPGERDGDGYVEALPVAEDREDDGIEALLGAGGVRRVEEDDRQARLAGRAGRLDQLCARGEADVAAAVGRCRAAGRAGRRVWSCHGGSCW